ncbi:hypothetical protein QBC36DRAFT_195157 [Triangularia setosa]|uniref:Protein kinase domain-containing protein n=1 Tax=Triangularia setosa TaxID=2587417 RepID=A0AAN7A2Q9_9PEZI|nr:hypothetical protein QBC36DRAFT_195157 [Podospora setosa]
MSTTKSLRTSPTVHKCPLCDKFNLTSGVEGKEAIEDHILGHLEEISLFSLPIDESRLNEDSNDESQSTAPSLDERHCTRPHSRRSSTRQPFIVQDFGEKLFLQVHGGYSGEKPDVALPTSDNPSLTIRLSSLRCPQKPQGKQKQFFPWGSVENLITPDEVASVLQGRPCHLSQDQAEKYAKKVCQPQFSNSGYRRIFAILVMIRRAEDIVYFVDNNIYDSYLPLEAIPTGHGQIEMRLKVCEEEKLSWLSHWDDDLGHENFETNQWTMLVPYFAKEKDHAARLYQLSRKSILPWLSEDYEHENGDNWVSKVEIHPHHHNFNKLDNCLVHGNFFAIKHLKAKQNDGSVGDLNGVARPADDANTDQPRINFPSGSTYTDDIKREFEHEIDILNRLSRRPHPHLITLLAAYQLGDECFMIFPWAECDLKVMWQSRRPIPDPPLEKRSLKWVLDQCLGLAQGLNNIHQSRPSPTLSEEMLGRVFGRHGDIKPENILLFCNDSDPNDRGKLVITDFGLTRFHGNNTKTYLRDNKPPATPTYRPPECDITTSPISQSFDIWSFGCVLLEFVAWYLGGWALIESFVKKRKLLNPLMNNWHTDQFFEILQENPQSESPQTVVGRVKQEVFEFVNELHSHPACSDIIHILLEFIMKKMVIIELKVTNQNRGPSGLGTQHDLRGQKHPDSNVFLTRAPCNEVVDELQRLSQELIESPDMLKATPWDPKQVKVPVSTPVEIQDYPVGGRYADLPVNHGRAIKAADVMHRMSQQRKRTHP